MPVLPGAEPFSHDPEGPGSDIGVLVSHGFTGSPQSMRPWAEHLAAQGFGVRLPRLPGHGTSWQELNRTRFDDWYAAVDAAFTELTDRYAKVVVAGLSMGGTLVTRLAEQRGPEVTGLMLVNPAYRADAATLVTIQVRPEYRRRGYGRTLLGAFAEQGAKAGYRLLHLGVHKDNPARALYEQAGYQPAGSDGDYLLYDLAVGTAGSSRT